MEIDSIRITREKWQLNGGRWRRSGDYQVAKKIAAIAIIGVGDWSWSRVKRFETIASPDGIGQLFLRIADFSKLR